MTKIIIELENCQNCPNFKSTPYPTSDSWERAENWWCTHSKWKGQTETPESGYSVENAKKISGYVEWTDVKHESVPGWCPIKIE